MLDRSSIAANATTGNGGRIEISTQGYFVSADSVVSANSEFGLDGDIQVNTINGDRQIALDKLSQNTISAKQKVIAGCSIDSDFRIAGKGGLLTNPTQNLRGQAIWQDTRILEPINTNTFQSQSKISPETIVEAQTWQVNPAGKIELVAIASSNSLFNNYRCQSN